MEDDDEQLDDRNIGDDVDSLDKQGEDEEEGLLRRFQIWYNQDKNIQTVSNLQVLP
jgi:hypothetical protein